jgi:hypothetical protein
LLGFVAGRETGEGDADGTFSDDDDAGEKRHGWVGRKMAVVCGSCPFELISLSGTDPKKTLPDGAPIDGSADGTKTFAGGATLRGYWGKRTECAEHVESGDDHGDWRWTDLSASGFWGSEESSRRSGATGIGRFRTASVQPRLRRACATVDSAFLLRSWRQRFSASCCSSLSTG